MRLYKSVRVLLGVAASGGVALLLSGSAMASDNSNSASTPSQVTGQSVKDSPAAVTTEAGTVSENSIVADSNKTSNLVIGSEKILGSTSSHDVVANSSDPQGKNASISPEIPEVVSTNTVTKNAVPVAAPTEVKSNVATTGGVSSDVATGNSVVANSVPTSANDASTTKNANPVKSVVFESAILPLRAKITNFSAVASDDLAATMPTAPVQDQNPPKSPVPAQQSGLLSRLATVLAGSVVPQSFTSPFRNFVSLATNIDLIIGGIVLMIGLLGLSFGTWLRRSGFVNAARSDMSGRASTNLATPFRMSYVTAILPQHSSFFLVADTKKSLINGLKCLQKGGYEMIIKKYASIACVACSLSLAVTLPASAATVGVDTTGPGSTQDISVKNTSSVTVANTTFTKVANISEAKATTGDVTANSNTATSGAITSGNATNVNAAKTSQPATVVSIANNSQVGGSGSSVAAGKGGAVLGSANNPAGSVLGAAVGGSGENSAILPVTGATIPVDVSALRNAWNAGGKTPSAILTKSSQMFTKTMLLTATLLSLLGALGSVWYTRRREERV